MSDRIREGRLVRYYCTAGNGLERFLVDEVKRKLEAENVCQIPGKVLFSSSASISAVSELKAAERLFLLLKQDSPVQLSVHTSPAKAASILQSKLLADRNQWTSAVLTWSRLQGELVSRRPTDIIPGTDLGAGKEEEEGRGDKEQRDEKEKCRMKTTKSTIQQTEKESEIRRVTTGEENGPQTLEKKRKREKDTRGIGEWRDVERYGEISGAIGEAPTPEKKIKTDDEEWEKRGGSVCDHARRGPGPDNDVDSVENVRSTRGEDKISAMEPRLLPRFPVCFRISCKCTGSLSRFFSSQELSKVIGIGLSRRLGWKADLKNPQLEVNVCLSDDHCLLGIPLTRLPLANRSYIKTTGLRSTVAWAVASLAQIKPGSFVVDPMCGVGTILIEAAQEHKDSCFLGVDIDDGQLQKANENVEFANLGNKIHLLKASSIVLPLPSASVDAVLCDLPFGRKFSTKTHMSANLPVIVTEMERVLCIGGTLVLLLSPQLSCLLKKLLAQKSTGSTSNEETKPHTGLKDCPSSTKQQAFQIHQGVKSSSAQSTDPQSEPQHSLPPPLSSLKHQATMRVSLGAIDGLIHKYVKVDA
ncbi:hypothetical protein Q5P01_021723 [Channa striata]|uniref:THUMP domain-containing protein n=1 Tax=Channa striata TaxID=64152 RepID=A0AA88LWA2_CHASR|nr:hypothetical protein Q5P01_021723 [Channa striata]